MARCQAAAEAAESTARRVGDRNATEPLGERAQAHVRARKTARAACTIAASATGLVADSNARAGLWAEAVRWEGLWETIPRPRLVQPAEK
jgi:multidrug resistance efflux pump